MKNSISRRSFIKKSAVGTVAAANASIFSGLVSAVILSCTETRYAMSASQTFGPYDSEDDATFAGSVVNPIDYQHQYDEEDTGVPCNDEDLPRNVPDPIEKDVSVTQALTGEWYVSITAYWYHYVCKTW